MSFSSGRILDDMGEIESASAKIKNEHQCKELVIDIPDPEPVLWPECCIYKVPGNLRDVNEKAYTPQLISIGPLHHDNKKLARMETQKSKYLADFLNREEFSNRKEETSEKFRSILRGNEKKIRRSYAEKSVLNSDEYVEMILLDAVFIIELFLRDHEKKEEEKKDEEKKLHHDDYMLTKLWLKNGIQLDLLLLENQLPYFVLDDLYKSAFPLDHNCPSDHISTFHLLTYKYFENYNRSPGKIVITDGTGVLHFTDLLRNFTSYSHPTKEKHFTIKNLPSAAKLHEAGVKFTVAAEWEFLTNIQFKKGKLIIPQFEVYDNTGCIFRNLMALEQCHYPYEGIFCNYIRLMDYLINTAKDVDLLVEKEIIVNKLGSNEAVANLVNELCINNIETCSCYHDICEKLNKFYHEPHHRIVATFWGVYFSNFWRGTSSLAAFGLLAMTLVQTFNSF